MRPALLILMAAALPCAAAAQQTTIPRPAPGTPVAPQLRDLLAPTASVPVDRVVAVVGSHAILYSDLQMVINQRRAELQVPDDSAGLAALERRVLDEMVDLEVLVQKAEAEKIEVPLADIEQTVDGRVKEIRGQFATEAEFLNALRGAGLGSFEEYRRSQIESLRRTQLQRELVQKLKSDGRVAAGPVSEAEITQVFEENKASLPRREATVGFRQIVVPPRPSAAARARARAKVDSLYVELTKGKGDFEQIAKRESMDAVSKELGGDLGWVRRGINQPEFDQVIFNIRPGVVSLPFETSYGWHIVRVERVQPAEVKVRQIRIDPAVDSSDVARAQVEADSVLKAWQGGAAYEALSARHHDKLEERTVPEYIRDSLPPSYRAAVGDKAVGAFAGPFPVANPTNGMSKYVVLEITAASAGGEYTVADYRTRIRDQLASAKLIRRAIDMVKKETYVSIRL